MYLKKLTKTIDRMNQIKEENDFSKKTLAELNELPSFNGVCELQFKNNFFYMLNIANDDSIPLKFFWRKNYEKLALSLWYKMTRSDSFFFDVGAHTGIYSIIGNIDKKINNIISLEPYHLNFSRLISNLRLNEISTNYCQMRAASNSQGIDRLAINTTQGYHTQGGKITENGNYNVQKLKLDDIKLDKKVGGIKIDTEGHEFEVIEGSVKIIENFKPDLLIEINENSFNKSINFLKKYNYKFYYLDEDNERLMNVTNFSDYHIQEEGTNCFATIKGIESFKI